MIQRALKLKDSSIISFSSKGDMANGYNFVEVSNIPYLDSPCGVGLSYSDDPRSYVTGDLQTGMDTHAFLLKWFELYLEFLSNPFYISGESYAGIYVPTLASEVVKGGLQGYMVGNGVTHDKFDGYAAHIPFAFGMGLISIDLFEVGYVQEFGPCCRALTEL
ncbi:hypothetical protein NL676_023233 [Syzygium grande]|nr:hypothetical protein NL676_023233 [Syzygium grande]